MRQFDHASRCGDVLIKGQMFAAAEVAVQSEDAVLAGRTVRSVAVDARFVYWPAGPAVMRLAR